MFSYLYHIFQEASFAVDMVCIYFYILDETKITKITNAISFFLTSPGFSISFSCYCFLFCFRVATGSSPCWSSFMTA
jgi:hypothetical protein